MGSIGGWVFVLDITLGGSVYFIEVGTITSLVSFMFSVALIAWEEIEIKAVQIK